MPNLNPRNIISEPKFVQHIGHLYVYSMILGTNAIYEIPILVPNFEPRNVPAFAV